MLLQQTVLGLLGWLAPLILLFSYEKYSWFRRRGEGQRSGVSGGGKIRIKYEVKSRER